MSETIEGGYAHGQDQIGAVWRVADEFHAVSGVLHARIISKTRCALAGGRGDRGTERCDDSWHWRRRLIFRVDDRHECVAATIASSAGLFRRIRRTGLKSVGGHRK